MQKILLISPCLPIPKNVFSPEHWYPPLGINYLSSILKKHNYDVDILDSLLVYFKYPEIDSIDFKYAVEKSISCKEYDFIGISVVSHSRIVALNISKKIKAISPRTKVIWGGPHASVMCEQIMDNYSDYVDAIVVGEGEDQIIEAINHFMRQTLSGMERKAEKKEVALFRSNKRLNTNLDSYPFPDYSSYSISSFKIRNASIIGSRGCPFGNCSYCAGSWIPFNERSSSNIVKEIELLINTYDINNIHIQDNIFTHNKNRTLDIFNKIYDKSLPVSISMKTRFDCIDEEIISTFCKIGGRTISFGLESGNQELRMKMGKDISNARIKELIKMIKENGISFGAYILLGHPEETESDINQTIDFLCEISPDEVLTSIVCIYPGTRLYTRALSEGKMKENDWLTETPCFTYVNGKRKQKIINYANIINEMFPKFIEWTEYSGLYDVRGKQ